MFGYGILALIAAVIGYLIYAYNALVKLKNLVSEGWSGIDVQLKRRADLIPNLIETMRISATCRRSSPASRTRSSCRGATTTARCATSTP